jgi:hypothetical protein
MITYTLNAKYLQGEGEIEKLAFANGDLALVFHTDEGQSRLNTNMAGYGVTTPADHIWVKTYAEHEGLVDTLIEAGIATFAEFPDLAGQFDTQWVLLKVLI